MNAHYTQTTSSIAIQQTQDCVLLVDDEVKLLDDTAEILRMNGYRVVKATNGAEALRVINELDITPDIIVSDIMMDPINGIELFREIRKIDRFLYVPFIFLTAKGEKDDVNIGREMGSDDYIIKPFDINDLITIVASKLKRHRTLRMYHNGVVSDIKRRILNIISHEFRTPLTFVVGYSELLNDYNEASDLNISNDDLRTFLAGVRNGAQRLQRLIENFMLIIEIEGGSAYDMYMYRQTSIDIPTLLQQSADRIFNDPRISHQCVITFDEIEPLVGDIEYLSRALGQMLENAIKFSQNNKTIRMGATEKNGYVELWVEDNGRGIPPEEMKNIWGTFHQINRDYFEDQGAGVGLAIVKGIAEIHGGYAEARSAVGIGSRFSIFIPRRKAK